MTEDSPRGSGQRATRVGGGGEKPAPCSAEGRFLTLHKAGRAARLCGQPVGLGSDSGRSPLCDLPAHSTWQGRGRGSCAPRLGVQAAPQSFPGPPWAAEKPLRSRLTSLGLTISGPSATQPSNPADGASPPETLQGALHPRGQKLSAQGGRSAGPGSARLTPPASGQRAPAGPG